VTRTMVDRAKRWRLALWAAIVALLVLPAVAMRFTTEVDWTRSDFATAALLLVGVGLAVELAARLITRPSLRAAAIILAFLVGMLIWAVGAVGLFH